MSTLKSLTDYLADINHPYTYRVKIAGDIPKDKMDKFKQGMDKFDVEEITATTTIPISEDPIGFPELSNESVNIFDITTSYPVMADQIAEQLRLAEFDIGRVRVMGSDWDDSMQEEFSKIEDSTRLETDEYPEASKESKEASKKYSGSFKDIVQNAADTSYEIAGGKPTPAKFNTDEPEGTDSPLTKNSSLNSAQDMEDFLAGGLPRK